jgi:hypothetical protein
VAERIRIDDLREPRLDELQRMALDYGESQTIDLSVDAVLGAAVARTGLDDFGPDAPATADFRERLGLWLGEVDADPNRTGLGRLALLGPCVRYASNRLLLHDLLRRHPEIHDEQIERPIIVAGLPRSGTTHLLNLLGADTRFRSLPLWESYEPVPIPDEATVDGVDARYARCQAEWENMLATVPYLAAMHPMTPDHIHEEIELQQADFSSYNLEWVARVPGWRDYYFAHDQTPHYEYMRTVLKALQWQDGPDRRRSGWVLKSPQHLEQLGPLLATFPDATVVITHRDPVSVVQSAATMLTYGARMSYRDVDADGVLAYWRERIEHILRASVRDRDLVPEAQRVDVLFHEFMADDVATVAGIYDIAGVEMTDAAETELRDYMTAHPRGKDGQVVYDLRGDFGVEPAAVREPFDFYVERFPVTVEVT